MTDFIITRRGNGYIAVVKEEGIISEIHTAKNSSCAVGNIYIGRVQSIVKNINAAFLDFGEGINGYLPLDNEKDFFYTKQARKDCTTCGDEILVQLKKEAVKTKLPVLTGNINIDGRFAVLVYGEKGLSFSKKIKDEEWKKSFKDIIKDEGFLFENCALIVRTNAEKSDIESVIDEIKTLNKKIDELIKTTPYRTCFSCVLRKEHEFINLLRDYPSEKNIEVITDISDIYEDIREKLPYINARLYEDEKLSLTALYSINTEFEHALSKHVWLKSGGYLILEPTEALTVIDVNTGGNIKSSTKEQNLFKTNMEAAKEIARQIRLRNYSGIIIVDFIDMKKEENIKKLISAFRFFLLEDRIQTKLIDMTKLNLAEVTRKRIKRPLHEAVKELEEDINE